ncbi:UNVERIFIED_CONTAM: hypothetical protein PYX00_000255 [Menopon gallinae]|uniref:peptidylglycine monooxygenase n=1 Tax=Menopon gallinae TaxID=328185 RepID=A0AAW2I934_9NEOP
MWRHLFAIFTLFIPLYDCYKENIFPLLMPNVKPSRPELYLCTPIRVNSEQSYFITSFEPNATMETAHHMIIYGCRTPGSRKAVWNCGEMAGSKDTDEALETASPCGEDTQVIFAWAMDAPKYELPEGVGFKVGKDSPIQYLVLQVHYANVDRFQDGTTDSSGIFLHYTSRPQPKLAGVLLLVTAGAIPPKSTEYMETSCMMEENKVIYPVAYRTHTHKLGTVVSGYKVLKGLDGNDRWIELGKRSPQTPQMFYPVENTDPIRRGDYLAARCTMKNHLNKWVLVGATRDDEMCNFYLLYYVEGTTPLERKYCFTQGPPSFYWGKSDGLNNIPNVEASQLLTP